MLKNIGSFSMWATIAMIADKFFFYFIPVLLAMFSNTKEIALFAVVISIEGYILSLSKTLSNVFLPKVMQMVVDDDSPEQQTNLMIKVGRIQLYIVGFAIFFFIGFGREFLHLWLGEEFDKSYFALIILIIPCLFHFTQTIAEELIYAKNLVKYRAFVYIIGSIISVTGTILLAPKFGAIGAAIAVCLSFIIAHNILIDVIYYRKLKIDIPRFLKECHLKILPVFCIALVLAFVIQRYASGTTFLLFGIKGVVWSIICLILLWQFSFNQQEKNILINMTKLFKS